MDLWFLFLNHKNFATTRPWFWDDREISLSVPGLLFDDWKSGYSSISDLSSLSYRALRRMQRWQAADRSWTWNEVTSSWRSWQTPQVGRMWAEVEWGSWIMLISVPCLRQSIAGHVREVAWAVEVILSKCFVRADPTPLRNGTYYNIIGLNHVQGNQTSSNGKQLKVMNST